VNAPGGRRRAVCAVGCGDRRAQVRGPEHVLRCPGKQPANIVPWLLARSESEVLCELTAHAKAATVHNCAHGAKNQNSPLGHMIQMSSFMRPTVVSGPNEKTCDSPEMMSTRRCTCVVLVLLGPMTDGAHTFGSGAGVGAGVGVGVEIESGSCPAMVWAEQSGLGWQECRGRVEGVCYREIDKGREQR
jgi:hypothetical protein